LPTLPDGAIHVEHVWKRFRADRTAPLFYDQFTRLRRSVGRRPARNDYRWVLKDVSLRVEPGGTLALIGVNGSGKTTLLKIISRVTYQTAGVSQVQGRLGALLSVTSGIHPDLTGRENVFLYGAILGMGRQVTRQRFDQIVEFAGLTDAIDRQVKFFSMGMQMRLGFSIAAFLEPDILLVDEVLSVGDANFQQKCLQRINEVVKQGTSLVYVSHDLTSVEATCARAIWLADATVRAAGPTRQVAALYRAAVQDNAAMTTSNEGDVRLLKAEIHGPGSGQVQSLEDAEVLLRLDAPEAVEADFFVGISQGTAFPMFITKHHGFFPAGEFEVRCTLKDLPLPKGQYSVWAAMSGFGQWAGQPYLPWKPAASFDCMGPDLLEPPEGVMVLSPVYVGTDWCVE
jgi:ABC-type polysaccharide/polyol phosphate transport system ATPase subunit